MPWPRALNLLFETWFFPPVLRLLFVYWKSIYILYVISISTLPLEYIYILLYIVVYFQFYIGTMSYFNLLKEIGLHTIKRIIEIFYGSVAEFATSYGRKWCWIRPSYLLALRDKVIKWKHFPRYCPFVRGINRSCANSPQKDQWRGTLMFSLICALNKRLRKQSWCWWLETPSR